MSTTRKKATYDYLRPDEFEENERARVIEHLTKKLRRKRKAGAQLFAAQFPCGSSTQYVLLTEQLNDLCNVFGDGSRYRSVCEEDAQLPLGSEAVEPATISKQEWDALARMSCFQDRLRRESSRPGEDLADVMAAARFEAGGKVGDVFVLSDTRGHVDVVVRPPREPMRHIVHIAVPHGLE